MSLREARAAALTRWHRDMSDNFSAVLPRVLDDLERLDQQAMRWRRYRVGGVIYESADVTILAPGDELAELQAANPAIGVSVKPEAVAAAMAEPPPPTDAQVAAYIERNPAWFEAWARKQARIQGGDVQRVLGGGLPVKPAPRRRTTR